jgi:hypothetical protein
VKVQQPPLHLPEGAAVRNSRPRLAPGAHKHGRTTRVASVTWRIGTV